MSMKAMRSVRLEHALRGVATLLVLIPFAMRMVVISGCTFAEIGCPSATTDEGISGTWRGEDIYFVIGHQVIKMEDCDYGQIELAGVNEGRDLPWDFVTGSGLIQEGFAETSGSVWEVLPDEQRRPFSSATVRIERFGNQMTVAVDYTIDGLPRTDTFGVERQ
jgi:hypothetical protein